MATEWYYSSNDQQQGPVTFAELGQLAKDGTLKPIDLVWNQGMSDWQPASMFPALFGGVMTGGGAVPANPYARPPGQVSPVASDGKKHAVAALIVSICGLICCVGLILGVIGFVMGLQAYNKLKANNEKDGQGFALAAIIIGAWDVLSSLGFYVRTSHGL